MSTTTIRLLRAAAEVSGGCEALARRLGIRETQLTAYTAGWQRLPDRLLLRAVDIILEGAKEPCLIETGGSPENGARDGGAHPKTNR